MNYDEFAFFNRQLANMLRSGVPLEGALRKLASDMRRGRLRREIEQLRTKLSAGVPLEDALAEGRLPEMYTRMVEAGARSNDLPGVLTLMADHYRKTDAILARVKGILVYPAIVIVFMIAIGVVSAAVMLPARAQFFADMDIPAPVLPYVQLFAAPAVFIFVAVLLGVAVAAPPIRRYLAWRVPPFKYARLAQTGDMIASMLRGGCSLDEAVALLESAETDTKVQGEYARWREELASGARRFDEMAAPGSPFPPLFVWMVVNSGEDVARGFDEAGRVYAARADRGVDLMLYGVLPVSIMVLGAGVLYQIHTFLGGLLLPLIDLMTGMGQM
ncbi:MAG: type II secretion system F family protein [Planctomycetota bacterium]